MLFHQKPSITICEKVTEDVSGKGLYAARFSDKNETIFPGKHTSLEKNESSTYYQYLVILGIYTKPSSPTDLFKGQ